jgi:hypothetical protein
LEWPEEWPGTRHVVGLPQRWLGPPRWKDTHGSVAVLYRLDGRTRLKVAVQPSGRAGGRAVARDQAMGNALRAVAFEAREGSPEAAAAPSGEDFEATVAQGLAELARSPWAQCGMRVGNRTVTFDYQPVDDRRWVAVGEVDGQTCVLQAEDLAIESVTLKRVDAKTLGRSAHSGLRVRLSKVTFRAGRAAR